VVSVIHIGRVAMAELCHEVSVHKEKSVSRATLLGKDRSSNALADSAIPKSYLYIRAWVLT